MSGPRLQKSREQLRSLNSTSHPWLHILPCQSSHSTLATNGTFAQRLAEQKPHASVPKPPWRG